LTYVDNVLIKPSLNNNILRVANYYYNYSAKLSWIVVIIICNC